jgi:4-hydroxyphenylpyruvate dioxygenase-like putative hemolysin
VATLALRCYTETLFTDANYPETTCTVEFAPPFSDAAITSMRPPKELDNGASLSRLGFSDAVEAALNAQVNVEMSASMVRALLSAPPTTQGNAYTSQSPPRVAALGWMQRGPSPASLRRREF